MQTKAKSNSIITHSWDEATQGLTFNVVGAGAVTLKLPMVSKVNMARASRHGLIQRVSDAAAKNRDPVTGLSAAPAEKLASMARLVDHYNSGTEEWNPTRDASGPGLDGVILAAVGEATGKSLDDVRVMVGTGAAEKGITPRAYLAALGTAKLVAPIVARIRGKDAGVSGDDLLAEAMSEGGE